MRLPAVCVVLWLLAASTAVSFGDGAPDALAARKAAWQAALDQRAFEFDRAQTGLIHALFLFHGDCQIAIVYDPAKWWVLTFKITRDGKELATMTGGPESVFVGKKGAFYFAQYSAADCGCRVLAFDTATGAKLWERDLLAAGRVPHSYYLNHVIMALAPEMPGGNFEDAESIVITGSEGAGDYKEVLEAATGTMLAHKVYRHDPYARPAQN
jgi:hypothetical protein